MDVCIECVLVYACVPFTEAGLFSASATACDGYRAWEGVSVGAVVAVIRGDVIARARELAFVAVQKFGTAGLGVHARAAALAPSASESVCATEGSVLDAPAGEAGEGYLDELDDCVPVAPHTHAPPSVMHHIAQFLG